MTSGANFIDDPRKWRVSKSGFSIRTGWNEDKTIIARYPGASFPLDNEHFQKWLDAAFAICDLYNSLLRDAAPTQVLTDLQRAVIDHDDDMARLDRNTLAPASPTDIRDEGDRPTAEPRYGERTCKHCGKPIKNTPRRPNRWTHIDTASLFCEPVSPSTRAKAAAEEIGAWIFMLEQPLTSETDLRVATDHVESIILKRCFSTEGEDTK